jgi:hypothetical protein
MVWKPLRGRPTSRQRVVNEVPRSSALIGVASWPAAKGTKRPPGPCVLILSAKNQSGTVHDACDIQG